MSKRAERRFRTQKIVQRRLKDLKMLFGENFELIQNDDKARRIGSCKKKAPFDCGHAGCYCCHHEKIDKIPTKKELSARLDFKKQIKEIEMLYCDSCAKKYGYANGWNIPQSYGPCEFCGRERACFVLPPSCIGTGEVVEEVTEEDFDKIDIDN